MHLVQRPVRHGGKGLGAVAAAGVGGVDAAAQLRAATAVEAVEHRLADQLPVQPHGEVHRLAVFKVPAGHVQEAGLRHRSAQAAHVVIAPPAVPASVQHQGVVGGQIRLGDGGEGQSLRFQLRDGRHMADQLVLGLEAVLGGQLGRAVLELGGPQAAVCGVVLPVDPLAALAECIRHQLHQGGVHAGVGVQGLFDVDDQRVAALFRQRQADQLLSVKKPPRKEAGFPRQLQHLPGQGQLVQGLGIVALGELRLIVLPEPLDHRLVRRRQGPEGGLRPAGAELVDMIALTGVAAAGEKLQVLPVVHIVLPGAYIADLGVGIAGQQPGSPALRNHGDHRREPLLQAVSLNGLQSGVLIALRPGHRVVKDHLSADLVADYQAARRLGPAGVQHAPPHELGAHGVLAQTVIAALIVLPQPGRVPFFH